MMDCKAPQQYAKNILSSAIYGETYGKYITHEVVRKGWRREQMAPQGLQDSGQYDRFVPTSETRTQPGWKYLSWWSCYRDLENDNLQKGQGFFEREHTSAFELRKLKGGAFYLDEQIDEAIKQAKQSGSQDSHITEMDGMPPADRNILYRRKTVDRKFFWGRVPRDIIDEFEQSTMDGQNISDYSFDVDYDDGDHVEVHVEMANEFIIRYARVPEGERPYEYAYFEDLLDHAGKLGIPQKLRPIQRSLNGVVRAIEDNLKLSANVILAIKRRLMKTKSDKIKPGMLIDLAEEAERASDAMQQVVIQDVSQSLLPIEGLLERFGDEAVQLPKVMQGQAHEKQKADTLGEIQILQANAGKYIGTVISNHDNGLIEPMGNRFHRFNMEDPDQIKGKGNFVARALGFSSFQDKIIRVKRLMQMMMLVMQDPELRKEGKLRKMMEDIFEINDVDPDEYLKSEEEKRQDAEDAFKAMMQRKQMADQMRQQAIQESEAVKEEDKRREIETEAAKSEFDKEEAVLESALEMERDAQKYDQELINMVINGAQQGGAQQ